MAVSAKPSPNVQYSANSVLRHMKTLTITRYESEHPSMPAKVTKITRRRPPTKQATPSAPPEQPTQPETMTLRLVLTFAVDGTPVAHTPLVVEIGRPAEDQLAQLQLTLDGRMLAALLEPHLGPAGASAAKLWTPGKGK